VAGPITVAEQPESLPKLPQVTLRSNRLTRLLGADVEPAEIERRLTALGMEVSPPVQGDAGDSGFRVWPPSWRFDIAIEADLIEEVARIGGFDLIAERDASLPAAPRPLASKEVEQRVVLRTLAARGFQEAITFAFVTRRCSACSSARRDDRARQSDRADLPSCAARSGGPAACGARESATAAAARAPVRDCQSIPAAAAAAERRRLPRTENARAIVLGTRSPEQWAPNQRRWIFSI